MNNWLSHLFGGQQFSIRALLIVLILSQVPYVATYWLLQTPVAIGTDSEIGIADLIEKVRDELIVSHDKLAASDKPALFVVKSFDMEIYYRLKRSAGLTAGSGAEVVAINAETSQEGEKSQKIVLHLEALGTFQSVPPNPTIPTSNIRRKSVGR